MSARPIVCVACLLASPAMAQDADERPEAWTLQDVFGDPTGLRVSGSARLRYETLDNQFRPGLDEKQDALLLRTTIAVDYDGGPVRVGAELMDSRVWLAGRGSSVSTTEVNTLEFVQAYVGFDLDDALGQGSRSTFDAGRFTMDVGSRRLIARNNFRNTTNSFTGFRAEHVRSDGTRLSGFYTLPNTRLPTNARSVLDNHAVADRQSFDLTFWGGFASTPLTKDVSLEAYYFGLDERDSRTTATRNRHLRTPGLRLLRKGAPGKVDFEVEGLWQYGSVRRSAAPEALRSDVSAWFVHGALGYTFDTPWRPRITVEYDRASGDKGGGAYNRFDTLFGARRFEFGPTSLYGALGRTNINSPGAKLEAEPDKRWSFAAMYRATWLDSATDSFSTTGVRDASGQSGKFAGQQIEARVAWWMVPKRVRIDFGGATLLNGRFLKTAPNANGYGDPLYGYVEISAGF